MIDFAKYAQQSHAAAYAFVSYQTAWLKYYYPVEFMAALMTSCIDNPGKVAEYILSSPPDGHFHSAAGHQPKRRKIHGGLPGDPLWHGGGQASESRSWRRSWRERGKRPFRSLKDFAERLSGKEVNKRTVENFIKAGAFDCFGVTRKRLMFVYANVLDDVAREKKDSLSLPDESV